MRKRINILVVFCCLLGNIMAGQTSQGDVSYTLEKLFLRLRENHTSARKIEINDSVRFIIDSYSVSDSVFAHRFSNLRFLGQVTSPDSLVKLITWNLIMEDGESRYFCNIIRRNSIGSEIKVYRLTGYYNENPAGTDTVYSESGWYGALYYDLRPFNLNGSVHYVMLGIDYGNSFTTRKIIDILSFDNLRGPLFGMKCFTDGKKIMQRVIFEYSAKAVMSLKFEADDLIVFDHLSPFTPDLKDNRQFYGPDFSFDSYKFEKGLWRYYGDIDIKNR